MIGRHDGNAGNRKERIDMQNEVWSEIGAFLNDLRCGNVNRKTYLHFPELEEAEQLRKKEKVNFEVELKRLGAAQRKQVEVYLEVVQHQAFMEEERAYCQIKSYNSMVTHYTELIQNNKDWIFSGIYADKAITGTKVDKRDEFQRLIQDCMDGKIDMVIAKSLPRFARNTLDTLKYVRMLKERNIAVYFEVEKINTLKDGEFLMTILSSVAQQEVENTSAYVKKGLKMKMKRGELVGFQGCLGYDYDIETKSISINEEGAEVVRYIFDRYVAGAGSTMIARELNEQGNLTIRGNPWTSSSIMGIINNEKYKGDILLGKTFTVDPISKRRLENLGEEDRYYIHNHHEPIITEEQFERAQEIRNRRNGNRKHNVIPGKREKFSRQFAFSCMVECGFCGSNLSRRRWHSSSKYKKTIWQCVKSTKEGKRFCPDSKGIPEQVIEEAFVESYRMLCNDNKDVLEEFLKRTEKALGESSVEDQIHKLEKSIEKVSSKRKKLLDKEKIILCNNNRNSYYRDPIGGTAFIRKDYFDKYAKSHCIKYFAFAERLIPETGYADETSLHFEIKDGQIIKEIRNDGGHGSYNRVSNPLCDNCPHANVIETSQNESPEYDMEWLKNMLEEYGIEDDSDLIGDEEMLFICYPKCSTCQKAKKWLDEHNIKYTERHIVDANPTYDELKEWYGKSGLPLKKFFNTSGLLYKEMQLKDKLSTMSEEEQLTFLSV